MIRYNSRSVYTHHRFLISQERDRFRGEINLVARAELPAGTRVAWRMPNHKENMAGEVTGHMEGETGMVTVKSDEGSGHTVRAWELEKLP